MAKLITARKPYEDIEIEIDDVVIKARMKVDVGSLAAFANTAKTLDGAVKRQEAEVANAKASRDAYRLAKACEGLAATMTAAVEAGIGKEAVAAILEACGCTAEKPGPALETLNATFVGLSEIVKERTVAVPQKKAAHYLQVVDSAQDEPNGAEQTD